MTDTPSLVSPSLSRLSSSSPPLLTPSFEPNASPLSLRPSEVTLAKLKASLPSPRPQAHPHQNQNQNQSGSGSKLKNSLGGATPGDKDEDEELDLELPISTLLRIGTRRAHVQAENSDGAAGLIKGELGVREYVRWMIILWRVYE